MSGIRTFAIKILFNTLQIMNLRRMREDFKMEANYLFGLGEGKMMA